MLNPRYPVAILRAAWRTLRLDAIRAAATRVIAELEALEVPGDIALSAVLGAPGAWHDASRAALSRCCDELREEAGLPATAAVRQRVPDDDPEWSRAYASELERYRTLAGSALDRLLVVS